MKKTSYLFTLFFAINLFVSAHGSKSEPAVDFIKNNGQWPNNVYYKAKIGGGEVWLENERFSFTFFDQKDVQAAHNSRHKKNKKDIPLIHAYSYRLLLIGSNPDALIIPTEKQSSVHNYFIGNDNSKWAGNVPLYHGIIYKSVYQGIDMRIHSENGFYKYDYILDAGADANQINWKYDGTEAALENGALILSTPVGEVVEQRPYAYQKINGKKVEVVCDYKIVDGQISFSFPKGYNKNYQLTIDPTLIFSSYTGSTADNWGFTATYDNGGNLYSGGIALAAGYPSTTGAFDVSFNGGAMDVAISKFNSTGTNLVYSTYVGGNNAEAPHSLIVDAQGNLYIMGTTSSSNFPVSPGAYDNSFNGGTSVTVNSHGYTNGSDIFVTKLNSAGAAIVGSTFVGGTGNDGLNLNGTLVHNYSDEMRGEIVLGSNGDVYVSSSTLSTNFPTTAGALATAAPAGQNACAFRLSTNLDALVWSTYIGGTSDDAGYAIKPSSNGNVYVTGGTLSNNFPVTAGTLSNTNAGGADGFVISLSDVNGSMSASSYFGTAAYDQSYLIEIDLNNDIYIAGQTRGAYPVSGGVYSNANGTQFVHKFNAGLTSTSFSTVFGSGSTSGTDISLTAFLVDNCQNIYVSGWGGTTNTEGSTNGLPVTTDAYDNTTDGSDFYFIVLERDAQSLLYATYFGGSPAEHVDGGTSRFDKNGTIYQAVCAGCGGSDNFPTTPGVWSTTNNSSNCNLGAIKMEFNYLGIEANASAAPNIIACDPPYVVNFQGANSAVNHYWDFDDGSPASTQLNPSHTFTAVGTYNIMYVAIDSSTCNIADTAYLSVQILQSEVFSSTFNIPPYDPCDTSGFTIDLEFTGTGADSLYWNLGNGDFVINDTAITYTYAAPGTYIVSLTAYDFTCNKVETFSDTVYFNTNVINASANASPNVIACDPPYNVTFNGGTAPTHIWDFDDGSPVSSLQNPSHTFSAVGNYNVMYVVIDSNSCNISDTAYLSVQILQKEIFEAEFTPVPPQPCRDTVLVNMNFTGTGADSLFWNMGDGTTFINDTVVNYFYTQPGSYTISLTAYDSTCNQVETITQTIVVDEATINGNVIIPNVFSPNSDNNNEEFRVLFSNYPGEIATDYFEKYKMQIFNRWGKKIFESESKGWDGTINGKPADDGVYFYIISYQQVCVDQEETIKTGHVTIVR